MFKRGTTVAETEQIVWSSLRQGNRQALDYIYAKYIRLLYAYGNRITKDCGLVEDCIQDLFVELWNRHQALSSTSHIKFYLMKSLRRRVVKRLAQEQRLQTEQLTAQDYEDSRELSIEFQIIQEQSHEDQRRHLTRALNQLSKRQYEAVYLKFYGKMSYREIADIMNLTVKSAYKLVGKSIDALRKNVVMSPIFK